MMQTKCTAFFVLLVVSMSMGQSFTDYGSQDNEKIEKYFSKLDLDGDKSLTTQELAPFIRSRCQDLTDAQLQTLINSFDKNNSGAIELLEFYTMVKTEVKTVPVSKGSYSYTAPDGTPITVNWVADENTFTPIGDYPGSTVMSPRYRIFVTWRHSRYQNVTR